MGTKIVNNIDDKLWRRFGAFCRMRGLLIGPALNDILKEFLDDNFQIE